MTAATLVTTVDAGVEVIVVIVEEVDADHPGPALAPVLDLVLEAGLSHQEIGGEMTAETAETAETGGVIVETAADVATAVAKEAKETAKNVEIVEIVEVGTGAGTPRLGKTGTVTEETAKEADPATEPTVIETSPASKMTAQEERIPSQDLPVRVRSVTTITATTR